MAENVQKRASRRIKENKYKNNDASITEKNTNTQNIRVPVLKRKRVLIEKNSQHIDEIAKDSATNTSHCNGTKDATMKDKAVKSQPSNKKQNIQLHRSARKVTPSDKAMETLRCNGSSDAQRSESRRNARKNVHWIDTEKSTMVEQNSPTNNAPNILNKKQNMQLRRSISNVASTSDQSIKSIQNNPKTSHTASNEKNSITKTSKRKHSSIEQDHPTDTATNTSHCNGTKNATMKDKAVRSQPSNKKQNMQLRRSVRNVASTSDQSVKLIQNSPKTAHTASNETSTATGLKRKYSSIEQDRLNDNAANTPRCNDTKTQTSNKNQTIKRRSAKNTALKERIMDCRADKEFFINEVVLATVSGYPPWPARIIEINGVSIKVEFFGTGEVNPLRSNAVQRFELNKTIPLLQRRGYKKAMLELELVLGISDEFSIFNK